MFSGIRVRKIFNRVETAFSKDTFDGQYNPTVRDTEESVDAFMRRISVIRKGDIDKTDCPLFHQEGDAG